MVRYQSSKLAEERKKQLLWKSALVAIIFISLVFFISQFFKLDYFAIKIINIEGNEVIRESTLVENIKNEISKNYLWIFPKKNSLFYPRYLVKEKLLHDFPRILELNLNLDLPSTLDVSLKEREPHVLWCKSKIDEESEEGGEICFFADKDGLIFDASPNFSNNIFFKYYTNLGVQPVNSRDLGVELPSWDDWEVEFPKSKPNILEEEKFKEIDSFVSFLDGLELNPYELSENGKSYEIYFGSGGKIILSDTQIIREAMENFQAILNMEEFAEKDNIFKVEYFDLRFGNKVFYK